VDSSAAIAEPPAPDRPHYAGFWARALAKAIDFLVLALPTTLVILALAWVLSGRPWPRARSLLGDNLSAVFTVVSNAIVYGAFVAYTTVLHGRYGATLGKMALGLRVAGPDGARPSCGRALARGLVEAMVLLAVEFTPLLLGKLWYLSYLWLLTYAVAAVHPRTLALHDMLCGTHVVQE
jgi:uncharacterized RDD family membrane protein YckC